MRQPDLHSFRFGIDGKKIYNAGLICTFERKAMMQATRRFSLARELFLPFTVNKAKGEVSAH